MSENIYPAEKQTASGPASSTDRRHKNGGTLYILFILLYLVAKPFYFFPSGEPQLSDFIMVLFIILSFFGKTSLGKSNISLVFACLIFTFYTAAVNITWSVILIDENLIKIPLFYLYNTLVLYCFLSAGIKMRGRYFSIVAWAILISITIQAAFSIVDGTISEYRSTLFFNNPNQLGYWGLLSAVIFAILMTHLRWSTWIQVFIYVVMLYIVALSLSKAAIISFFLLMILHFSKRPVQILIVLTTGLLIFIFFRDLVVYENATNRIQSIGAQVDDSLTGRGYDRLWRFPEYLVFGAGEFSAERKQELDTTNELHSTLGTVLFSYGIIGLALFARIFWKVYRHVGIQPLLYTIPVFAYGMTHQGLRFSLLWVVIAIALQVGTARRNGGLTDAPSEGIGRADAHRQLRRAPLSAERAQPRAPT